MIEAARSQIAATVLEAEVAALPMNGRNSSISRCSRRRRAANIASNQLFPETRPFGDDALGRQQTQPLEQLRRRRPVGHDDAAGLSGIHYAARCDRAVSGDHVRSASRVGRALGGYVNVVTKSGTNELHGNDLRFFRDAGLNASNSLSGTTLPMRQSQFGASAGGPLLKNRTFFFGNIERRDLNQTGLATILDPNVAVINARLNTTGYGGPAISTGIYPNPVTTTNVLAKIDHQFSARDHFSMRYSRYVVDASNARGAGGLSAPSASSHLGKQPIKRWRSAIRWCCHRAPSSKHARKSREMLAGAALGSHLALGQHAGAAASAPARPARPAA